MTDNLTNRQLAERMAQALGEPRADLIEAVINELGPDRAAKYFRKTARIQAEGGMLTRDGSRKRTAGGVFFQLVKGKMTAAQRRRAGLLLQADQVEPA